MRTLTQSRFETRSPQAAVASSAHVPAGAVRCPEFFTTGFSPAAVHAFNAMYFAAAKTAWDQIQRERHLRRTAAQN